MARPSSKVVNPNDNHEDESVPEEVSATPNMESFERTFTETKKVISDVFKLMVANVWKQTGVAKHPDIDPMDWAEFEHTHVFRTFDSEGKKHDQCVSTGGHFHKVAWKYVGDKPVISSISGPMTYVQKKLRGKYQKIAVPVNDFDKHTHDFKYLKSHEVSARVENIEAVKVIALEASKGANPGGVVVK